MSKSHLLENVLSMSVGTVLALTVGAAASHWCAGAIVIAGWGALHGLTWGFGAASSQRRAGCQRCR